MGLAHGIPGSSRADSSCAGSQPNNGHGRDKAADPNLKVILMAEAVFYRFLSMTEVFSKV